MEVLISPDGQILNKNQKTIALCKAAPDLLEAAQYLERHLPEKITGQLCITIELLTAFLKIRAALEKVTDAAS